MTDAEPREQDARLAVAQARTDAREEAAGAELRRLEASPRPGAGRPQWGAPDLQPRAL